VQIQTVTQDRYCVQCGNLLKPNIKFCEVCGREVAAPKQKEEPVIVEPTTMDELVIPEINEQTFARDKEKMMAPKFDGFEAAVMPDSQPAQPTAPPPTPEFAMDSAASSSDKPKPKPTVSVKAKPVQPTAQSQPQSVQTAPQQNVQQPSNPYPNQGMPNPNVNAGNNDKKGLAPVQIALIVAIIFFVVLIFVFIISGNKKKDNASENAVNIIGQTSVSVQADIGADGLLIV
jgi:RNA polymerase subunit RPABC4/transcription elongation factor Spt4